MMNKITDLVKLIKENKDLIKSNPELSDKLFGLLEKARDEYDDWNDADQDEQYAGLSIRDQGEMDESDDAAKWLAEQEDKKPEAKPEPEGDDQYSDENMDWDNLINEAEKPSEGKGKGKSSFVDDMSDEDLQDWQHFAHHWSSAGRQMSNQSADASSNPINFAEGHREAAHNKSHKDFRAAYEEFKNSEDFQSKSKSEQRKATREFKKQFKADNPDHTKNAMSSYSDAHGMHSKAMDHYNTKKDAALDHILSGGVSGSEDTMSTKEAASHFGVTGDEGQQSGSRSTVESSFAQQNPEFIESIRQKRGIKGVQESDETLDNPDKEIYRHPSLSGKHKDKMDQLFGQYGKLIEQNIKKGANKLKAKGIPENEIDESDLREHAMYGLINAVKTFKKDRGAGFNTHASSHIQSLIESKAANKDPIHRGLRSELKAWNEKKADPSAPKPEEPKTEAPKPVEPTSHTLTKDPQILDRIKRVKTMSKKPAPVKGEE
jgi:hypothetical protein